MGVQILSLRADIECKVNEYLSTKWNVRNGQNVPEYDNVKLGNDAVKLDAVILYADLAESTQLVNTYDEKFSACIYKSYLDCAARIIRSENGIITSYDGDRVMAVYIGDLKNTQAARTALKINYCVNNIINKSIISRFSGCSYRVKQAVGIDASEIFVARTGIRGSNDLVWVGRAANYAAKLCGLREDYYATWITSDVYNKLSSDVKNSQGKNLWEKVLWPEKSIYVYRSSWWYEI